MTESACCCNVRQNNEKNGEESPLQALYETLEPYLITLSGLSLVASFFHILPFEAAWIAIVISGSPILWEAIGSFRRGKISVEVLIAAAIIATIIADLLFPETHHGHSYIFAGGEVSFIMSLGHWLEEWTISKARASIELLLRLAPQTARRLDGEMETVIPAAEIRCGNLLRVLPGDTVPADGEITSGHTTLDQSLLTGESMPVERTEGDSVFGGTINQFGSFTMQATKVGGDSSFARMIQLIREAEQKKSPIERIADRWATFLVPTALLTAAVVGLVSYGILDTAEESFRRAVTILVVFCPCSLVLATPTAVIAAIGNASHHGILIRTGAAVEQLGSVNVLAFDKTGTLTYGKPRLTAIQSFDPQYDDDKLLTLAASGEKFSEHPLAACIVVAAAERNLTLENVTGFELYQGKGFSVQLNGKRFIAGNHRVLERFDLELNEEQKEEAERRFDRGETVIWLAVDSAVVGLLSVSDTIREVSKKVIEQVQRIGIETALLTGDNERSARRICEESGIDRIYADLLPKDKVDTIERLKNRGSLPPLKIAMIGDGLNDAPALKAADVGIAMGRIGSDLTINEADVVLMGDDISRLPFLIRLSKKTKRTILGNICLSMGINAAAICLAALGFLGPVLGALVHNAGSLFVVLNASLILQIKE